MPWVSDAAKKAARRVNLFDYLTSCHPHEIKREGNSLRLDCNHSVSVRRGYSGYTDFATGDTGNAVDCLTNYLGYSFQDAVAALCQFEGIPLDLRDPDQGGPARKAPQKPPERPKEPPVPPGPLILPEPVQGPYKQLYAYLTRIRKIPAPVIQQLLDSGLLYQERTCNNIVFVNPEKTFAELRGTNSDKPFHRVLQAPPSAFWWCKTGDLFSVVSTAYICEGAIDAISLRCLHQAKGQTGNILYCGIGGVGNTERIECIRDGMAAAGCPAILAVDNDKAGTECRQKYPELQAIVPVLKDWNEDWIAYCLQNQGG